MSDYRQQEELEEERETALLLILARIGRGEATMTEALFCAREFGLLDRFIKMMEAK